MGNQTNGFRNELAQRETNAIHTCTVIPHLETLRSNVAQEHCNVQYGCCMGYDNMGYDITAIWTCLSLFTT